MDNDHGVAPSVPGLLPSVEPVPVSPADAAAIPNAGIVVLDREVFDFLMGTAPYDGVWFDEYNANLPGRFWWRAILAAADRGTARVLAQGIVTGGGDATATPVPQGLEPGPQSGCANPSSEPSQ